MIAVAGMLAFGVATAGACTALTIAGVAASGVARAANFGADVALAKVGGKGVRGEIGSALAGRVSKNLGKDLLSSRATWGTIGRAATYCRNCWGVATSAGLRGGYRTAGAFMVSW